MLTIGICDDEPIICDMLAEQVSKCMEKLDRCHKIQCFHSAIELRQTSLDFDIILLDIQMPGISGIDFAKSLREQGSESSLIFITALKERVFDVFELEAVDYLCKPVKEERLMQALERGANKKRDGNEPCLFIQTMNWCKAVRSSTIYYGEIIDRKMYLYTTKGVIEYYGKMEEAAKQLDSRFVKCHRSYLVNLDYLREYADGQILLENGSRIPVSRLRHREVMDAMLHYMKGREV